MWRPFRETEANEKLGFLATHFLPDESLQICRLINLTMQWQVLQAANLPLGLPADYQLGQKASNFCSGIAAYVLACPSLCRFRLSQG
jgi:hypothetical protein